MKIWVDADACPAVIKKILFAAAERAQVTTTLVANQPLKIPPSPYIKFMLVQSGFDVADNDIVKSRLDINQPFRINGDLSFLSFLVNTL